MTITREPLYEDASAGRIAALGRHVVAWFANIGQTVRQVDRICFAAKNVKAAKFLTRK